MVREHHNSYVERIEIFVGQGATPEAMTRQLVPVTDIVSTEPVELGDYFIPETSGLYNIGFHAVSEANEWYMFLRILSPLRLTVQCLQLWTIRR